MSADKVTITLRDGTAYTFEPAPGGATSETVRTLLIECLDGTSPFVRLHDTRTGQVVKVRSEEIRSVR